MSRYAKRGARDIHTGGPYRSRRGIILGVCRGLAEHFEFPVWGVRLAAILIAAMTTFWAVLAYIIAGLIMKPAPLMPLNTDDDAEFYNAYAASRTLAIHRLSRRFESLNNRIERIENHVTARDYDWDRRLGE